MSYRVDDASPGASARRGPDDSVTLHGTEVVAVAVWRDRESLVRFSRADFDAVPEDQASEWILEAWLHTYEAIEDEAARPATTLP